MQHPRRTGFDAHDVEVGASGATAVSVHVSVSVPVPEPVPGLLEVVETLVGAAHRTSKAGAQCPAHHNG